MAGDFFELFKNACNFFCARRTAYWLVEMETSNIPFKKVLCNELGCFLKILTQSGPTAAI
jgi:hypothetical protein